MGLLLDLLVRHREKRRRLNPDTEIFRALSCATDHSVTNVRLAGQSAAFTLSTLIVSPSTEPGTGDHRGGRRRLAFHWPSVRCVLIEGIVNPVVVVVVHVIANEPPQMFFVQRDDMVEDLAAAASYPALRNSVLPRRLDACAL